MQWELQGGAAGPALSLLPVGETRVTVTAWATGSRAKLAAVAGRPSAPAAAPPPFTGCQRVCTGPHGGAAAGLGGSHCHRAERPPGLQSPSAHSWSHVCCLPAASTAPGSSSCGTPTSSCARARPTSAGKTPACGSSSASTSRSLTAARCRCRSPRTPSSAVSGPPTRASRPHAGAFPSQGRPSFLLVCVCRLRAVLPRHIRVTVQSRAQRPFLRAQRLALWALSPSTSGESKKESESVPKHRHPQGPRMDDVTVNPLLSQKA